MANPRAAVIAQMARARGLDPAAVLAIASVEGGFNGAIGDHGSSFGPFQLHVGGALPSGLSNPQQWANSQAGISYALDRIAKVAGGLQGKQAVTAISSRFERPADVAGEVAKASSRYGQFSGGKLPTGGLGALPAAPRAIGAQGGVGGGNMAALQMLAQSMQSSGNAGGVGLLELLAQRQQAQAAQNVFGPTPTKGPVVGAGAAPAAHSGSYSNIQALPGVNIAKVDPALLSRINQVAKQHGVTVTINSGYRSPQHSVAVGGFANDPHTRGVAVDAYVNGKPIGDVFGPSIWKALGVTSGDVPNFYHGSPDPEHLQIG